MEETQIRVVIESLTDILFDPFFDHSREPRPAEQKFYYGEKNQIMFPAPNIIAFLFNKKGSSCVNKFEGKKRGDYYAMGMSHIFINPQLIPFKGKDQKPVFFTDFNDPFYIVRAAPTTKQPGGDFIKQPAKPRPALKMPWSLEFQITLYKNPLINDVKLRNWFEMGGILIAFGTYRPLFGRFRVKTWEKKN